MSGTQPSVLVVDDEPNVAEAYALWLRDDYAVDTAFDGEEALETVSHETDVVLLDRRMPNRSGDEALSAMREAGYDCRVAMVTAVDPDFDIVEMPFDSYLTKPVTREDIQATVEELLDLARYDDAVREQFALAEKQAALETGRPKSELKNHEEYQQLRARQETLAATTEEALGEVDHESFKSALSDLNDGDDDSSELSPSNDTDRAAF